MLNVLTNGEVIAVGSLAVAVSAFGLSAWQGYLTKKHFVLSVRPHVEIVFYTAEDSDPGISLKNHGFGPAVVDSIVARIGGSEIDVRTEADYDRLSKWLLPEFPSHEMSFYLPDEHTVMGPGASIQILKFSSEKHKDAMREVLRKTFKCLELVVRYRCLYGELHESAYKPA